MTNNSPLNQKDPLEELYVNKNEVDRQLLANLLMDYIGIDEDTLNPVFKPQYKKLKEKQKILIYLLYRVALVTLGKIEENQIGQTPKEIAKATGINYNSVRGYLSQLNSLLDKRKDKEGYYIPFYNISAIKDRLNKKS